MTATMAFDSGNTIWNMYLTFPQPSMDAASQRSLGSVEAQKERTRIMLYTEMQVMIIIRNLVLLRCRLFIRM